MLNGSEILLAGELFKVSCFGRRTRRSGAVRSDIATWLVTAGFVVGIFSESYLLGNGRTERIVLICPRSRTISIWQTTGDPSRWLGPSHQRHENFAYVHSRRPHLVTRVQNLRQLDDRVHTHLVQHISAVEVDCLRAKFQPVPDPLRRTSVQ